MKKTTITSINCQTIKLYFFFNDTATTEIYTLSLHDALPIYTCQHPRRDARQRQESAAQPHRPPVAHDKRDERAARHRENEHGETDSGSPIPEQPRQPAIRNRQRSEEYTSELQSRLHLVCRLL